MTPTATRRLRRRVIDAARELVGLVDVAQLMTGIDRGEVPVELGRAWRSLVVASQALDRRRRKPRGRP